MFKKLIHSLAFVLALSLVDNVCSGQILIDDHFTGDGLDVGDATSVNGGFTLTANSISAAAIIDEVGSNAEVTTTGGNNGNAGITSITSIDPLSDEVLSRGLTVEWVVTSLSETTQANGNTYTLQTDNVFFNTIPYVGVMFSGKADTTPDGVRFVAKTSGGDPTHSLSALYNYERSSYLDGFTVSFTIGATGWMFQITGLDDPSSSPIVIIEEGAWPAGFSLSDVLDDESFVSAHAQKSAGNDLLARYDRCRVWIGSAEPLPYASGPNPKDGAMLEATWASLSWRAGDFAVSHDVYFGDNFDDVNSGAEGTFVGNLGTTSQVVGFPGFPIPDGLQAGTTYYWRIDEVNDADPNSPWNGDIWSFSIPPKTAYNPDPADGAQFVDPNAIFTWTGGYGSKLHTVYLGDNYDDVNNAAGGMPMGMTSYDPATLEREKVLYWRVDEFDGVETHKGDIWSFTTPGAVGNPQPANGAADVQIIETLSWTAADSAASHELYFGTDADAVNNATTASPEYVGPKALAANSYDPGGLAWDSSYAWRVDEVYPDKTVKGLVWTFATADFILVEDFESYNDIDPPDPNSNRIFDKWIDGYGTTTNGALVGNDMPPYAEQTVVQGGAQSLVYRYDNNLKTSEATLTLVYPRDWTKEGVTKLSLWHRGASANTADRMFVALNGTSVVYHDDASATQMTGWNQWTIDLQAFAGVNLSNVNTITIGIGTKGSPAAGGAGTMYFDDIRLIR